MKLAPIVPICLFLALPAYAQQFQQQVGKIPGPVVWSEGVVAFDANNDGLMDLIYANGVGFSTAGGALLPTLLMNQGPVTGFLDQTAARIPAGFVLQAKGVRALDADDDGDADLVFANAFNNQPRILINDGTGVFTDQTAARFPVINLNSFGVAVGDIDNDADLDLVFAHAGASAFGGAGGMARLFLNDGTGVFTIAGAAQFPAVNKIGAQGAQISDLDNDFDLDIVVEGKSVGQQTYLNNGTGSFTYFSSLLPAGTASTYAFDVSDLDNDNDTDGLIISLSGFNEGTAKNNLIETTALTFTGTTTTLTGLNGQDDNDIAFLDANNDGILDVIIGSLANSQDKLYINGGTFASASFVYQPTGFSVLTDSTLDLAVADFDNDNRYDVATAQGESGNFLNRWYKNTGPADTQPPRIGRVEGSPATVHLAAVQAGLVRRAWIQDSVLQDGHSWVEANLDITADKGGDVQNLTPAMGDSWGQIWRGVIQPAPSATGMVGMDVSYKVHAVDPPGYASDSTPISFRVCGWENYGSASAVNKMTISSLSDPTLGQAMTVQLGNGPASQPSILIIGFSRSNFPIFGGTVLVNLGGAILFNYSTDALGNASIPLFIPNNPPLEGLILDMQGASADPGQPQGWSLSVGLEASLCGQ